jgi:ferredoxin--NADP+ reductase
MLLEGDRLQVGDRITGHYTLDAVRPDDTVIFLSTGTGEAPHNYMLWELLTHGHRGRILAVCCVRYLADLGYAPIHKRLMAQYRQYTFHPMATREPSSAGKKVYIQDLFSSGQLEEMVGRPLDSKSTHVYLCGNPAMIGLPQRNPDTGEMTYPKPIGVIEILESRFGFQRDVPADRFRGNIHSEEYW